MNNLSNYINIDFEGPNLVNIKYLNNKCKMLLKQIEELKYNYQEMIMNRNNKEYTFIDGGKLVHIQPYTSEGVQNVNVCKAMCSKQKDCYGFNTYDNMALFNKYPTQCDFISSEGDTRDTGGIKRDGAGNSLYIKIDDENVRTTKKILDRLISEFHASCNRNMSLIERFESFSPSLYNTQALNTIRVKDGDLSQLKREMLGHKASLAKILNDTNFIKKEYDNSHLHTTRNNIMLSIYTLVIIILIVVILKINLVI
jgi:hypothetical protein